MRARRLWGRLACRFPCPVSYRTLLLVHGLGSRRLGVHVPKAGAVPGLCHHRRCHGFLKLASGCAVPQQDHDGVQHAGSSEEHVHSREGPHLSCASVGSVSVWGDTAPREQLSARTARPVLRRHVVEGAAALGKRVRRKLQGGEGSRLELQLDGWAPLPGSDPRDGSQRHNDVDAALGSCSKARLGDRDVAVSRSAGTVSPCPCFPRDGRQIGQAHT